MNLCEINAEIDALNEQGLAINPLIRAYNAILEQGAEPSLDDVGELLLAQNELIVDALDFIQQVGAENFEEDEADFVDDTFTQEDIDKGLVRQVIRRSDGSIVRDENGVPVPFQKRPFKKTTPEEYETLIDAQLIAAHKAGKFEALEKEAIEDFEAGRTEEGWFDEEPDLETKMGEFKLHDDLLQCFEDMVDDLFKADRFAEFSRSLEITKGKQVYTIILEYEIIKDEEFEAFIKERLSQSGQAIKVDPNDL